MPLGAALFVGANFLVGRGVDEMGFSGEVLEVGVCEGFRLVAEGDGGEGCVVGLPGCE